MGKLKRSTGASSIGALRVRSHTEAVTFGLAHSLLGPRSFKTPQLSALVGGAHHLDGGLDDAQRGHPLGCRDYCAAGRAGFCAGNS